MNVNFLSWTEQPAGGSAIRRRESLRGCCKHGRRRAVRRLLRSTRVFIAIPLLLLSVCATTGCDSHRSSEGATAVPPVARNTTGSASSGLHAVVIRPPPNRMTVETELMDRNGNPVTVACNTCHTVRPANPRNRTSEDLDQFHQGLQINHGRQACTACHNPTDGYATLRLADGTAVSISDSMRLCAQCHGPQFRDYEHGCHGGMNGYWDLSRGPRERNHCIHCHDPHAPKVAVVQPVAGPRDRFPPAQPRTNHE